MVLFLKSIYRLSIQKWCLQYIIKAMNTKFWASIAVGLAVISTYCLYKLSSSSKNKKNKQNRGLSSQRRIDRQSEQSNQFDDRTLYSQEIIDPDQYSLIAQNPNSDPTIDSLSYYVILNINKGTTYQGVVKIKTISKQGQGKKKNMKIDYAGNTILYIRVNGTRLQEHQFVYQAHVIKLDKKFLQPTENDIEIIFSSRYAFMGNGLTVYFPLDQKTNRYSLKKQIVYSRNGVYQAPRIIPCLNILNQCKIQLQILHADGFDAFSNAPKSLYRSVSKQNYPCYSFMFQASERKLNRSFKMNTSGYSQNNSSYLSFDDIIKENSQFYEHSLDSIHDLFIFCGKITEVRPSIENKQSSSLLIRYFARQHLTAKAVTLLNILQCQIIDIFNRIQSYKKETCTRTINLSGSSNSQRHQHISLKSYHKVDIFFIDDINSEGDFHKGSILLNQTTIERGVIDRRIYYLICRAFVGMGVPKHQVMLALKGKLQLNELTVSIFPQCSDFVYLKQIEYKKVRQNMLKLLESSERGNEQFWAQQFYEKHCKYFVRNQYFNKKGVNSSIITLNDQLNSMQSEEYWNRFISAYPFLEKTSAQILIKISIKQKGIPKNEEQLQFAKINLEKSKYYLKFISNQEIQKDLQRYIHCYGVQQRLPFIKVKAQYSDIITENNNEKYLRIKTNKLEAHNLYEQFKRFNEERSFHHYTIIKDEIKRIKTLAEDKIKVQRKNLQCGLMGWKLLSKLWIYPEDDITYNLIMKLLNMKGKGIRIGDKK